MRNTVRVGLKEENVGRERKSLKEESLRVSERKRISVKEFRVKGRECQWKNQWKSLSSLSVREISRPLKFLGR